MCSLPAKTRERDLGWSSWTFFRHKYLDLDARGNWRKHSAAVVHRPNQREQFRSFPIQALEQTKLTEQIFEEEEVLAIDWVGSERHPERAEGLIGLADFHFDADATRGRSAI